jgi:hypothetical protein
MKNHATSLSFLLLPWFLAGLFAGFLVTTWFDSPVAAHLPTAAAAIPPQNASGGRVFGSDAAIMVKFIKRDRAADFEAIVTRLKQALEQTRSPERRQQAAGWRVFRAVETATNGDVVYVFAIDRPVRGADYAISKILAEAFPAEAQSLYRRYADSYSAGQNVVNLMLIAALGDEFQR